MRVRPLAVARLSAYAALTALLLPAQIVLRAFGPRWAHRLPVFYHALCCRIVGLRVRVSGRPADGAALLAANHGSYLDISVLGGLVPAAFVAKAEVRRWPVYGYLADLQRTVFAERTRAGTGRGRDATRERLLAGERVVLFPEGTSSDGQRVLPFKSGYFEAARGDGARIAVQPVSIAYTKLNGLPICQHSRPSIAWYGAMELAPHILAMVGLGRIDVEVRFHPPVFADDFPDRKALAAYCHAVVADGVAAHMSAPIPVLIGEESDELALADVGVWD